MGNTAKPATEVMKSPWWWLRHDRIARSRLFVLAVAVALLVGSAVFDWPSTENALIALGLSLVLVVGDYFFWRADLRKAGESDG